MLPTLRQQAWISGLPNMVKEGGILLEVLPFPSPKPDARSLNLTIFASGDLVFQLQSLSKNRTKLPRLSLVARVDAVKKTDYQYLMSYAVIDTVMPIKDLTGAHAVSILFQSITMTKGVSLNPGPPVNHPPIQSKGVNTGWIFGLSDEKFKQGKPVEIVDFTPPHFNRRLTITLGNPSSEIQNLLKSPTSTGELILVLPDRSSQRYVEFKLWDAKTILLEDEWHIAYESDMIECLTGKF